MEKKRKGGAHLPQASRRGNNPPRVESVHKNRFPTRENNENSNRMTQRRKRRAVSHRGIVIGSCAGGVLLVLLSLALVITSKLNKIDYNDGKVATPGEPAAQRKAISMFPGWRQRSLSRHRLR